MGDPDSFTSALGYVVLSFAGLEQLISRSIVGLVGTTESVGVAVTAELSFAQKVHLLSSLVRLRAGQVHLAGGKPNPVEIFSDIAAACFRAEELRSTLLHSFWESVPLEPAMMTRFKRTAKAKHGFRVNVEDIDSADVLDVADFIDRTTVDIDFFFMPEPIVIT